MSFNINEFRSVVAGRGLAVNNLFMIQLTIPASMNYLNENISQRELSFLCKTTDLPAMGFEYQEVHNYGIGKPEKIPMAFQPGELTNIFMVDSDFGVLKFFHRWMQTIMNLNTYDGRFVEDPQGKLPYEIGYKEDYAAPTMTILVYSGHDANKVYRYTFGHVFPIAIGNITTSWENDAEIMSLPVTFGYDKFKTEALALGKVRSDFSRSTGFLTWISSLNTYGQAINQIDRPRDIQDMINQITNVNTIFNSL